MCVAHSPLGLGSPLFPVGALFPWVNRVGRGLYGVGGTGEGVEGFEAGAGEVVWRGRLFGGGVLVSFFWCPSTTTLIFSHLLSSSLLPFPSFSLGHILCAGSVDYILGGVLVVSVGALPAGVYPCGLWGGSFGVTRAGLTLPEWVVGGSL